MIIIVMRVFLLLLFLFWFVLFYFLFFKLILAQNSILVFHDCIWKTENSESTYKWKKNNHSLMIKSKLMNEVLCQSKQSFTTLSKQHLFWLAICCYGFVSFVTIHAIMCLWFYSIRFILRYIMCFDYNPVQNSSCLF